MIILLINGCLFVQTHSLSQSFSPALPNTEPDELVRRLQSPDFSERQKATFQILKSPHSVLPLIESEFENGNAEFQYRALKILKELSVNANDREGKAFKTLQRLATSEISEIARKASQASFDVLVTRQHRAARKLERLNARISYDAEHENSGFPLASTLVIDERWRGTETELHLVRELFGLTWIEFNHRQINDSVIESLASVYGLKGIKLRKCAITNRSMNTLAELGTLTRLEILYCPIGPESLDQFEALSSLQSLRLIGTKYDVSHQSQISANVHGTIDIRRGAYLGILYNQSVQECILTSIADGSGAQAAGLKVGDQIIEYEGKKTPGHLELTELLRVTHVEHTTKLKVKRKGQILELEVTLGEWQ